MGSKPVVCRNLHWFCCKPVVIPNLSQFIATLFVCTLGVDTCCYEPFVLKYTPQTIPTAQGTFLRLRVYLPTAAGATHGRCLVVQNLDTKCLLFQVPKPALILTEPDALNAVWRLQVLVGLDNAGKSTLLCTLRGVKCDNVTPTWGFARYCSLVSLPLQTNTRPSRATRIQNIRLPVKNPSIPLQGTAFAISTVPRISEGV